ncbi:MAG TPA: hypothetical protein VK738_01795 [Terriglobales bacterium]|jgi:hypothetical protein|nr:hypothetical protein [Terriglobales bacterium]
MVSFRLDRTCFLLQRRLQLGRSAIERSSRVIFEFGNGVRSSP